MHMSDNSVTTKVHAWRPVSFALGLACGSLSAWGAYEYALGLEGKVTYVVIAAPLIAAASAIIPPLAEDMWRKGHPLQATLWSLTLIPCLAVVFFAAYERVHYAKAHGASSVMAGHTAVSRAEAELAEAKQALRRAEQDEARAKAQKECGPACRTALETAKQARERTSQAEQAVARLQAKAVERSPLAAPAWLLPVAMDAVAFMAIWSGLSGPWVTRVTPPARQKVARKPTPAKRQPSRKPRKLAAGNENVPSNVVSIG